MPLDRVNGEVIDGFAGSLHVVIEPRLLASMDNLKTEYQVKSRFRVMTKRRSVFDDAVAHAIEAFSAEGAMRPIRIDETSVLVQVYPKERKIAVMFQRMIAGKEYFVTRFYDLPQPVLDTLLMASGKRVREH
jgi:hypothetical protein